MQLVLPVQIKFEDLVDSICRSAKYLTAKDLTKFDIGRLESMIEFLKNMPPEDAKSIAAGG